MPRKNGIQVTHEVKEYYALKQAELDRSPARVQLKEPKIVFLTAFATTIFRNHVSNLGIKDVYEKPIQLEQLRELLTKRSDP
jgi:CheY-like chemotaxis protein